MVRFPARVPRRAEKTDTERDYTETLDKTFLLAHILFLYGNLLAVNERGQSNPATLDA